MSISEPYEYMNDFLYFVIRPGKGGNEDMLVCCSGVNVSRFSPLVRGRHGQGSNPAVRGLQLVNLGVRDLALSKGIKPISIKGNECGGIAPEKDTWYTERLAIAGAPESFPDEIINYCVINLLKKIFKAGMLEFQPPSELLMPHELQLFIENICRKM